MRSRWRDTEEEGEEEEWSDEEQEEDERVNTVNAVGIRLSDTIIFRPMTSPRVCGREGEEEEDDKEEEGEEDLLGLDSEMWRYCLLTPCVCLRYEKLFIQSIRGIFRRAVLMI